jgi:16S rRNA (cytidine1402-2'-O)-methyltransferase
MKNERGILYLVPALLGEGPVSRSLPEYNLDIINSLQYFIVEETRTARRFLRKAGVTGDLDRLHFLVFNEHSAKTDLGMYLQPLVDGYDTGLLSEAGIPCLADPGSEIVRAAHDHAIRVVPLTGPSSIFLALAASGFNGQNFIFHGYLPVEKKARSNRIRELERALYMVDQTQIFIEAPYRNVQVFQAITENCRDGTLLCLATDLTTPGEYVTVRSVGTWKKNKPEINKKPTVFLLYH